MRCCVEPPLRQHTPHELGLPVEHSWPPVCDADIDVPQGVRRGHGVAEEFIYDTIEKLVCRVPV